MRAGRCETKYCRNKTYHTKLCSSCRCRESREKNPVKYCYNNLKHNAKRRGIEFALTFEQFLQFCYATNYMQGKGKTRTSFSIDRIDNDRGYTLDNIRILTLADNSAKGNKKLHYDWETGYATVTSFTHTSNNTEENYF